MVVNYIILLHIAKERLMAKREKVTLIFNYKTKLKRISALSIEGYTENIFGQVQLS